MRKNLVKRKFFSGQERKKKLTEPTLTFEMLHIALGAVEMKGLVRLNLISRQVRVYKLLWVRLHSHGTHKKNRGGNALRSTCTPFLSRLTSDRQISAVTAFLIKEGQARNMRSFKTTLS